MTHTWQRGLALAVALTLTASASAQGPKKDFKKSADGGPRGGSSEIERVRADINALEGQIDRVRQQVAEINRKLDRVLASSPKTKGSEKMTFEFKGPPMTGRPGMEMKSRFGGEMAKGGPPNFNVRTAGPGAAGGGMGRGEMEHKRDILILKDRIDDSRGRSTSRGPSTDLESRVNRLEQAIDELRREIRNRR